jgi:N-acetyl-gamma-glutamyl-phosphate reductase
MKPTVFIDGEAGTTGLQIRQRLSGRTDIDLVSIDDAQRKNAAARAELLNDSELVILCLPDKAAEEAVALVRNPRTKIIDASSAHRTAPGWVYGFPELSPVRRREIAGSRRIANPGCYPTGVIALLGPLIRSGRLPRDGGYVIHAVSGYSGGGKALIAEYEAGDRGEDIRGAFRTYGLTLEHKHVPEIVDQCGLAHPPVFSPAVARFAQGMIVEIPLQLWALGNAAVLDLRQTLREAYRDEPFVAIADDATHDRLQQQRAGALGDCPELDPRALNGTNRLLLFVFGNERNRQARLIAILDNLGKGASGAAVQNLNIALGLSEGIGL